MLSPDQQARLKFMEKEVVDIKDDEVCWTRGTIDSLEKKGNDALMVIKYNGKSVNLI